MTKRFYVMSAMLVTVLGISGCSDLARVSQPANPYTLPDKAPATPKCLTPQVPDKGEGPNSPAPSTQEAQTNCR